MNKPFAITVSPTGARKTRSDHPNIPLTPAEIADASARCLDAGACMLHLHVRKPDFSHSLEVADYRVAMDAVRQVVGNRLVIQITTEAMRQYSPAQQINVVKSLRPEAVSLALREIVHSENDLSLAAAFFTWMFQEHVIPQFILYSTEDVRNYLDLRIRGVIPEGRHWLLFVLGQYNGNQISKPVDLLPFLDYMKDLADPWTVCAFGQNESVCITAALTLGGHARVGFENNHFLPDGSIASGNHELVAVAAQVAHLLGVPLADADILRGWFN
jgi:3-keto-5-aminohexanoate cleavage enzyme